MVALHLVPPPAAQPLSILAEAFSEKLSAFNDLTRDMREASIVIKALAFPDNKIFIDPASVEVFSRRFGHELRAMRYSPAGRFTCNTVRLRGVDVAWYSLVKEQDQ
ncbi:hypothetical protein ACIOZM_21580 [Pseudomonas sp. NPDC087346]|uniref:hypothetical protein n=1 Tax=Pseudomonas sp. NPDC087346 TaxID=3364438 RepID=UPI0037F3F46C